MTSLSAAEQSQNMCVNSRVPNKARNQLVHLTSSTSRIYILSIRTTVLFIDLGKHPYNLTSLHGSTGITAASVPERSVGETVWPFKPF